MFDQQVTFLYTHDLAESARFYGDVIGLTLILDQGSCQIFQTSPNAFLGVCSCNEHRPPNPEGVIITLVTNDVDGWYKKLTAKGVTFENPPAENPKFNIYHCFLRDPDGYQLEIQQFGDPSWPKVT